MRIPKIVAWRLLAFMRERDLIEQIQRPPNEVDGHETPWITTTSRVEYVVSMYGVPLRVGDTRFRLMTRITDRLHPRFKNMAAADSELALLPARPYDISGPFENPVYHSLMTGRALDENRYRLVAARLDGPEPDTVRRMIDDTLLAERLAFGYTFGEAAYTALSALSWQIAVVGDPLYRPFRYSIAEQRAYLVQDERPKIEWAHVRYANILIQQGRFNVAMNYLRAQLREPVTRSNTTRLGRPSDHRLVG